VYYWFGTHFSTSLLVQALLTIVVHILLLHVALDHRPPLSTHQPFAHATAGAGRPYDFWQWRSTRPYWTFLSYFALMLLVLHFLLAPTGLFLAYSNLLGYIALAIEATLPIPQLLANYRRRGCKGFRVSVVANWIMGDTFKMWFFFASGSGEGGVPLAFKICAVFQALCDLGLGAQFWIWGDGPEATDGFGRQKAVLSPVVETAGFEEKMGLGVGIPMGMDETAYGMEVRAM
jgi:solute carrier family 66, member 2